MSLIILVSVAAYDRCWFFGDTFGSRSFKQYFKARASSDFNGYVKAHYDVTGFFNNFVRCDNPSILSRLGNLLVQALNNSKSAANGIMPLPKLIVVVVDDDILKLFKDCSHGVGSVTKSMSRAINFVMTAHECAISTFKEFLPAKSLKKDYPHILWIQPPEHKNFDNNSLRYKFNRCLDDAAKMHHNVTTLMMKKGWDPAEDDLFLADQQRFSTRGLNLYWEGVDRTTRYFDSLLLKKQFKAKSRKTEGQIRSKTDKKDHFHWQNPTLNVDRDAPRVFRQLPSPPPQRTILS